jgi:hypothetical protein
MFLYHFSNKNFEVLKPDFFGENSFTKNDAKFSCKRFFCYAEKMPAEKCFSFSNFRYTLQIDEKNIYNLETDILKLKEKFNFDIDKILAYCKKNFHGIKYFTSFQTFCIFRKYNIFKKENLILGKSWK